MKHYRKGIVLCLASVWMLTGCQIQPEQGTEASGSNYETEQMIEKKTEAATTEQSDIQVATGALRLQIEHHYYDSEENSEETIFFFGEYDTLQVTDTDPESSIKQALETWANEQKKNYLTEAAGYASEAKEDTYMQENNMYYYLKNGIQTERVDSQVVSLSLANSAYRGGVHGDYWTKGVTFDTYTGEQLTLADLGDIQTELKDYIWKQLEPDSDELFEDSEQVIADLIETGDICWYLTGQGIQIVINPYEIASFAAGQRQILVPYQELTEMKSEYIPEESTAGIMYLSLEEETVYNLDMNNDGLPDTLHINVDYESEGNLGAVTIGYNTSELILQDSLGVTSAYICKDSGTMYLLLTTYGYSDYQTTRLYEFPDGEPIEVYHLDGGKVWGCSQDGVWIEEVVEKLGTYWGYRYYILKDGILQIESDIYNLTNTKDAEYRHGITPKQDISVRMERGMDGALEDSTLRAGITIYPVTIQDHPESGTSTIGFELIDGTYGELEVRIDKDGRQYVNGIEQTELFDDLPYAG